MTSRSPLGNAATPAGRKEWTALAVLVLPLLLVSMDVSVLYFAVPFISRELEPSATEQLWIFDIYGFVLGGLLLTMGALGDRIGRRKLLLTGAAAFGAASVAAAYATTPEMLITARALLGLGGATLMPSTLGLIRELFHDAKQRATAIAVWSAVMTGGVALGPVLSGLLLEHFWWGSIFLVNLPAMLLLLALAPALVPEFKNPAAGRFDWASSLLSLGAILPVIYGVKELAADGYAPAPVVALAAGLALGGVFLHRQRTVAHPMIDLALFRRPGFAAALCTNLVAMFVMVGFAIFTTQYLQSVLAMSPLEAALWSLVSSAAVGVAAPLGVQLAHRVNRAYVIGGGFLVAALGFLVLTQLRAGSPLVLVLAGAAVYAMGVAVVMTLITDLVLGAAPAEQAGTASGLLESVTELGGAMGMAVLGSVGAAVYRRQATETIPDSLPDGAADAARETLGGAGAVAGELPGPAGDAVLTAARAAFTDGMNAAAVACAVLTVAAALAAAHALRAIRIHEDPPDAEPAAPAPAPFPDPAPAPKGAKISGS